jgi:hypothetical protein
VKKGEDSWSSLEADASAASLTRGPKCGVAILIEDIAEVHGKAAADSVVKTLANHRLTSTSIYAAIDSRASGQIKVPSSYSIGRHRNGRCSCPREDS